MQHRVVLANGCFDPLHHGHLLHLEAARSYGDELWVALTSDASVRREKGNRRPLFSHDDRARMLKALRCVDHVVIVDSIHSALGAFLPAVFVKGSDYAGKIDAGVKSFCERNGIQIRITDTPKWSATQVGDAIRSR